MPALAVGSGEVVIQPCMPCRIQIYARLYHGIDAMRGQAERNFSGVFLLVANLRLMFLGLNH